MTQTVFVMLSHISVNTCSQMRLYLCMNMNKIVVLTEILIYLPHWRPGYLNFLNASARAFH
jgi:hypothetical protein